MGRPKKKEERLPPMSLDKRFCVLEELGIGVLKRGKTEGKVDRRGSWGKEQS